MVPKVIVGFAAVARCILRVYICTVGSSWPFAASQRLSSKLEGVKKGLGGGGAAVELLVRTLLWGM